MLLILAFSCGEDAERDTIPVVVRDVGGTDTLHLARLETPDDFALPFVTYVADDMRVRVSEAEDFVQFEPADTTKFSGRTTFIHLFVHPAGTTLQRARKVVETFAASRGVPVSESETAVAPFSEEGIPPEAGTLIPPRFEWALLEVPYAYRCLAGSAACELGRIALGRHGGRYFHVVVQYPPEAAEFMRPRVAQIFLHWRWLASH